MIQFHMSTHRGRELKRNWLLPQPSAHRLLTAAPGVGLEAVLFVSEQSARLYT